ncbi:uncharacterized protein LOC106465235 isoform X4 [Limulus polyphemus]|uniref:Uncharacterized protein LOC106465235 isoform X4 n=1 Tax=Limulus polyphemus TaxID=6850 RepID=A0ABM1SYV7_LIMPO|nr:uncharacterized protein LOC106465235 isoform X4 [Limulus polyphemus]
MEVFKMKVEPFSDEEQNVSLDIKKVKKVETLILSPIREKNVLCIPLTTSEVPSIEDTSLSTVFEFVIVKDEPEEDCNKEIEKTENTFARVKHEQPSDLHQDEIVSKFNDSGDDDVDISKDFVKSMKTETGFQEELQQPGSGLDGTSGKDGVMEYMSRKLLSRKKVDDER